MEVEFIPMSDGECFQFEAVAVKGGRWRITSFPSFFALIVHPDFGPILFDAGYNGRFFEETQKFPFRLYRWVTPVRLNPGKSACEQVVARGFALEAVRHVIISHFHADHVGGLRDFPAAAIHCSREAAKSVDGVSGWAALKKCLLPGLLPDDYAGRLRFFETDEQVPLSGRLGPFEHGRDLFGDGSVIAVPLPGHAPGQTGLLLRAKQGDVFLVADACLRSSFYRENRNPGFVPGMMHERVAYRQTLMNLRELHRLRPELEIIPSHCNEVTW